MHLVMVIGGGLALLAICLLVGWWGGNIARACIVFAPLWLMGALFNMYWGVARAGYTVAEELPVLAVVFVVPSLVAGVVWWKTR